jgi:hypothetical protein
MLQGAVLPISYFIQSRENMVKEILIQRRQQCGGAAPQFFTMDG